MRWYWWLLVVICAIPVTWYIATSFSEVEQLGAVVLCLYWWHTYRIDSLKDRIAALELRFAQRDAGWSRT